MSTATYTVTEMTPEVAHSLSLIGKIVTVGSQQYTVHAIEGTDWYAFDRDGTVILDQNMTRSMFITEPIATLIPSGHTYGDGHTEMHSVRTVKRGVSLGKSYR